jgi:two-component system sensor histidine kinase UhpB
VARVRAELETRKLRYPHLDLALAVSAGWPASIRARCADHLLRIVLEAFDNARFHGGATRIDVALRALPGGQAEVCVSDDGRGLHELGAPLRAGMGLSGMHERAILLGGRLVLADGPGGGTQVRVRFDREVMG